MTFPNRPNSSCLSYAQPRIENMCYQPQPMDWLCTLGFDRHLILKSCGPEGPVPGHAVPRAAGRGGGPAEAPASKDSRTASALAIRGWSCRSRPRLPSNGLLLVSAAAARRHQRTSGRARGTSHSRLRRERRSPAGFRNTWVLAYDWPPVGHFRGRFPVSPPPLSVFPESCRI
jgi:hypothetical protein